MTLHYAKKKIPRAGYFFFLPALVPVTPKITALTGASTATALTRLKDTISLPPSFRLRGAMASHCHWSLGASVFLVGFSNLSTLLKTVP